MGVEVNYLAVFLAGVSSMVVGSIWYAPSVFGNTWMKLAKLNEKTLKQGSSWMYLWTFILSLLTAYILAHVTFLSFAYFDKTFLESALSTAFWLWLGLIAARIATHDMFEHRRKKLTLLTVSHELITLVVMALIIGVMQP